MIYETALALSWGALSASSAWLGAVCARVQHEVSHRRPVPHPEPPAPVPSMLDRLAATSGVENANTELLRQKKGPPAKVTPSLFVRSPRPQSFGTGFFSFTNRANSRIV